MKTQNQATVQVPEIIPGQMHIGNQIADAETVSAALVPLVQTSGQAPAEYPDKLLIDLTIEDFFSEEELMSYIELCKKDKQLNGELIHSVSKYNIQFNFYKVSGHPQVRILYENHTIKNFYSCSCYFNYCPNKEYAEVARLLKSALTYIPKARAQYIARFDKEIIDSFDSVKKSFLKLGSVFKKMRDDSLYPDAKRFYDRADFYEYIEKKYDFKKSTVCNMIAIVETFCIGRGQDTLELKPMFTDYNYSQLTEILSLPIIKSGQTVTRKELPAITATVTEIREKKKADAAALRLACRGNDSVQISGQDDPDELIKPAVTVAPVEEIEVDYSVVSESDEMPGVLSAVEAPKERTISFKNNDERDAFIKTYATWPLWLDIPAIHMKIYRCKLSDGRYLYAAETFYKTKDSEKSAGAYSNMYQISDASGFYFERTAWGVSTVRDHFREQKMSVILPGKEKMSGE